MAVDELRLARTQGYKHMEMLNRGKGGHYLAVAPDHSAMAGTVFKLIELGLKHDYAIFCGCWTQTPDEQRTLMRAMGLSPEMLEREGLLLIRNFADDFALSRAEGILQNWRDWAQASVESERPIMGIGTPALDCWEDRPQDLVQFEADLHELWQSVEALSICVYPLSDFIPEGYQRLGTLMSHHDGLITWAEGGSILMERNTAVDSIFNA
jgi:hypothetical protein